jgi:hypothetical protein
MKKIKSILVIIISDAKNIDVIFVRLSTKKELYIDTEKDVIIVI